MNLCNISSRKRDFYIKNLIKASHMKTNYSPRTTTQDAVPKKKSKIAVPTSDALSILNHLRGGAYQKITDTKRILSSSKPSHFNVNNINSITNNKNNYNNSTPCGENNSKKINYKSTNNILPYSQGDGDKRKLTEKDQEINRLEEEIKHCKKQLRFLKGLNSGNNNNIHYLINNLSNGNGDSMSKTRSSTNINDRNFGEINSAGLSNNSNNGGSNIKVINNINNNFMEESLKSKGPNSIMQKFLGERNPSKERKNRTKAKSQSKQTKKPSSNFNYNLSLISAFYNGNHRGISKDSNHNSNLNNFNNTKGRRGQSARNSKQKNNSKFKSNNSNHSKNKIIHNLITNKGNNFLKSKNKNNSNSKAIRNNINIINNKSLNTNSINTNNSIKTDENLNNSCNFNSRNNFPKEHLLTIDEVKGMCDSILKSTKEILEFVKFATIGNES